MKNKYGQKRFLAYSLVALILVVAAVFVLEKIRLTNFIKDPFYKPQSETNSSVSDSTLKSKADLASTNTDLGNTSKNTSDIPVSATTTISIDSIVQSGGMITYDATVVNPGDGGACSAVFTRDGSKPVTRVSNAHSDGCGPVSIPELEFESVGVWTLTLRYYINEVQAITTKAVEVH
jgi:cytoskeletal protein RodZ